MPTTRVAGVSLDVEGRPRLLAPRLERILAALHELTPKGGPSFLILERGRSYMQTAGGGSGRYLVEWREDHWPNFRHFAAGRIDGVMEGSDAVATTSGHIDVRSNEVLSRKDVETVILAFARGDGRPSAFSWREMTDNFS